MDNRYNHKNRRKYNLKVHIVIVTKYRKKILKDSIAEDVKQYIGDVAIEKAYVILWKHLTSCGLLKEKAHKNLALSSNTGCNSNSVMLSIIFDVGTLYGICLIFDFPVYKES